MIRLFRNKKISKIAKYSLFILAFYSIIIFFQKNYDSSLLSFLRIFLGIAAIFAFGLNITEIISKTLKKIFDLEEFICVSIINVLIFFPLIIYLTQYILGVYFSFFPFLTILASILANVFMPPRFNTENKYFKFSIKYYKELLLAFSVFLGITIINFSLYSHLPDLDPYGWINRILEAFQNTKPSFHGGGDFFVIFSQLHKNILNLDLFFVLKYIYPLYATLIIFPLSLIARPFKSFWQKITILLFGLVSSTIILAFNMPMPQLIWLIIFYFFISFLLHFENKKDGFYFIFAGVLAFWSTLYHSGSYIFLGFWSLSGAYNYREFFKKNKLITFLIILIFISNIDSLERGVNFIKRFSEEAVTSILKLSSNFLFPAYYQNIDGSSMGWSGFDGVMKYYIYYAGPVIFTLIGVFIFLIFKKNFRLFIFQEIKKTGNLAIFSILLFFLILAEILPRFFNIAFLPDRVWVFLGPSFILILVLIYKFLNNTDYKIIKKFLPIFIIITFVISLSGAIYINWQKRFLITKEQGEAAQWIRKNISSDSLFLSSGNRNVLVYNAKVPYKKVDPSFYESLTTVEKILSGLKNESPFSSKYFVEYKEDIEKILETTVHNHSNQEEVTQNILRSIQKIKKLTNVFFEEKNSKNEKEVYQFFIFYAPPSPKNPYLGRPYNDGGQWGFEKTGEFIQDQDPRFERIYNKDGVIIWKIKNLTIE